MKALSIKQPWAWAIVELPHCMAKDIENRTWDTKFRGRFLVHASLAWDKTAVKYMADRGIHCPPRELIRAGGIVGESDIYQVVTDPLDRTWFAGPFGFCLRNSKSLPFHPSKGKLGFFECDYPAPKSPAAETGK